MRDRGVSFIKTYLSASGLERQHLGERNGESFLKKRVLFEWFRAR